MPVKRFGSHTDYKGIPYRYTKDYPDIDIRFAEKGENKRDLTSQDKIKIEELISYLEKAHRILHDDLPMFICVEDTRTIESMLKKYKDLRTPKYRYDYVEYEVNPPELKEIRRVKDIGEVEMRNLKDRVKTQYAFDLEQTSNTLQRIEKVEADKTKEEDKTSKSTSMIHE